MTTNKNIYFNLARILEEPVDYKLVEEFLNEYMKIAEKKGIDPHDLISRLKNASAELHDSMLTAAVKIQGDLPIKGLYIDNSDWISIPDAAVIYSVSTATIRNWIKTGSPPLENKQLSARKTMVSMKDLRRFSINKRN
jgi:hypothetical protein